MVEIKNFAGKMDLDNSPYRVAPNDYVNAVNITKDAVEGSNDKVVSNIIGNQIVPHSLPTYASGVIAFTTGQNPFTSGISNIGTITAAAGSTLLVRITVITPTDFVQGNIGGSVFINTTTTVDNIVIVPGGGVVNFNLFFLGTGIATISLITGGTNVCIGAYAHTVRNTVIYFVYNSNGSHSILEYNRTTGVITKIFQNLLDSGGVDILGFTLLGKITSINIYTRDEGDLLYFIDSLGRPTGLNITNFKGGLYTPVTRQIINVIKAPPLSPPSCIYGNDTTRRVNNTRNRFFRFNYLFIYDDNEESVCSPISAMPLPVNFLDDTYTSVVTNNNVITLSLYSGDKNVKSVQLLVSYVDRFNEWTDFAIVETLDKATLNIPDRATFSYSFYNDSAYPTKDPQRVIQLFDYVPDIALAQEMPNGNVLNYGNITEGYNRDLVPNVVNVVSTYPVAGQSTGSLDYVLTFDGGAISRFMYWTFSGLPAAGTVVTVTVRRRSDGLEFISSTYTTVAGDTATNVAAALAANNTAPSIVSTPVGAQLQLIISTGTYEVMPSTGLYSKITITAPTAPAFSNSIPTFKPSTQRNIGIAYFDQNGKTNGILYNGTITFLPYSNDVFGNVNLPIINTKIYHVPPIWAYSFDFYFTEENTSSIFWETVDVNITETDYIYFDVTDFKTNADKYPTTQTVVSYSFQEGDRLRLLGIAGMNVFYPDTHDVAILGLVAEPKINGVVQTGKTFIKIKKTSPFSNATFATNYHNYIIELYTPAQKTASNENETYRECGRQYPIINPGTSLRVHGGEVTNQSTNYAVPAEFNFKEGDWYFRPRTIAITDTGIGVINVFDRNVTDNFASAVNSLKGRPNIIDINAKTAHFGATIRFGQAIEANTNINGLNRFYPNNLVDVDASYGDIIRLKIRDRYERVFQRLKVGTIPLFNQISKNADGTQLLVVTDKLLNPIQYYIGDFGIGDNPESLASYNFADYFTTNIKGIICRVSNDGIEPISVLNLVDSWATQYLPQRGTNYKMYGAFDQKLGRYILAMEASATDTAQTIMFNEKENGFQSFLTFYPEMMVTLGTLLIAFKNGQLYAHDSTQYNTFFGVAYDSSITPVFNQANIEKKTFQAVEEVASIVWDCPEINTSLGQQSNLVDADFEVLEGCPNAAFLRDVNSPGSIIEGDVLKGQTMTAKFRAKVPVNLVTLSLVSVRYTDSALTITNQSK